MNISEVNRVTVNFPEFKSRLKSQCHPAMTKSFTVGEEDDVEQGILTRTTFEANVALWMSRGYEVKLG